MSGKTVQLARAHCSKKWHGLSTLPASFPFSYLLHWRLRPRFYQRGFFFTLRPVDIIIWQFIAFIVIFIGQLIARGRSRGWAVLFCSILLVGIFLMLCGTVQTSSVASSGEFAPERQYFKNATSVDLEQGQQVSAKLQSLNIEARFSYYLLSADEYGKMIADASYITTSALAQDYYVNQASFLQTVQSSGRYYLLIRNEYFLSNNVTYSITIYKTQTQYSSLGTLMVIIGTSGLSSYALAMVEQGSSLTEPKASAQGTPGKDEGLCNGSKEKTTIERHGARLVKILNALFVIPAFIFIFTNSAAILLNTLWNSSKRARNWHPRLATPHPPRLSAQDFNSNSFKHDQSSF